jgi:hypothetical protein
MRWKRAYRKVKKGIREHDEKRRGRKAEVKMHKK